MSQHCPVCKTKLWTGRLFSPARLHCPRCGAEFKRTVPWSYVRVLLLIVIAGGLFLVAQSTQGNVWLFLFLLGLAIFLWLLPRIIDLQHIGPALTPSEGLLDPKDLSLEDAVWEEKFKEFQERVQFRNVIFMILALALLILFLIGFWKGT